MQKIRIAGAVLASGLAVAGVAACSNQSQNEATAPTANAVTAPTSFTIAASGYLEFPNAAGTGKPGSIGISGGSINGSTGVINTTFNGGQQWIPLNLSNVSITPTALSATVTLSFNPPWTTEINLTGNNWGQFSGQTKAPLPFMGDTNIVDLSVQPVVPPGPNPAADVTQKLQEQLSQVR